MSEHFIFYVGQENDSYSKIRGFLDDVSERIVIYDDSNGSVLFSIGNSGGTIGGGGTLNYLAKFTPDGTTIGDSLLYDNGVSVAVGTATPDASATLDLTSTSQGFLAPRMTQTERNAIISPANGLFIYNTTSSHFNFWDGVSWKVIESSTITSDTLSQVLAAGNTTGGLPIVMSSGDTINFSVGSGGSLNSLITTGFRNWNLPDVDGTIALLDGGQTFTSATWNGTQIGTNFGGTNITSYTSGDIIYASSSSVLSKLSIGTNGQVLTVSSGLPSWQNTTNGTVTSFSSGNLSPLFTTSVSTPTTTPALLFTLSNSNANTWFGNNTGSLSAPSYNNAGSLIETTSSVLTISGNNTLLGNTTIQVKQSSGSQSGYLSYSDWTTFNNKQNALSFSDLSGTPNQIILSASGTGVLVGSTNITLSLPQSINTSANVQFGSLGINESPSFTSGTILMTGGANNITLEILKRNTDTSPTGNFVDYQTNSGSSLWTVDISGVLVSGSVPTGRITNGQPLTKTDDTNVTITLGGTPATSLLNSVSLTMGWTGQLSVSRGGTGVSTFGGTNTLLYTTSADTLSSISTSNTSALVTNSSGVPSWASGVTANRVLRTDGSSISFSQVVLTTDVSGILPIANGGTNAITANSALNNLLPTQTGNNGKFLQTDGSNTSWVSGNNGTVTSFSSGDLSPLFTTSVATSTTTPALSFNLTNSGANTWFGNNTSGSTAPSYNSAGTISRINDTNVILTLGGTPANSVLNSVSFTMGWSGTLSVSRGGTGVGTFGGTNTLLYTTSANTLSSIATSNTSAIVTNSTGVPSWTSGATANRVLRTNGTTVSFSQVDLITDVTGTLPATNGGTGFASYTVGDILSANTTTTLSKIAAVASGSYLRSAGTGTLPVWSTLILPNSATSQSVVFATATNTWGESTRFTYNSTNNTLLLTQAAANANPTFQVTVNTTSANNIYGAFYGQTLNNSTTSIHNAMRLESGSGGVAAAGLGQAIYFTQINHAQTSYIPQAKISASYYACATGSNKSKISLWAQDATDSNVDSLVEILSATQNGVYIGNNQTSTTNASALLQISGNLSAASWTTNGIEFRVDASTYTDTGTAGTRATAVASSFGIPTYASTNAVTITDSINVYIAGSPAANSGNITQTRLWALYIAAGNVVHGGNSYFGAVGVSPSYAIQTNGSIAIDTAGGGFLVKEGTNATMGVATLSGGTATVSTTKVTANSRIHLTVQSLGTVTAPNAVAITSRTAGTSFVITSASASDTSVVMWQIFEPA